MSAMEVEMETSPTKRERQRRLKKLQQRMARRAALPILTREQIRRYRLPFHEAIIAELEEDGYVSSADYVKQLLDYQQKLVEEHGPDSAVACRPRLCASKDVLTHLYTGLKCAEDAHYKGNIKLECEELIKLGAHFGLGSQDWWWLGEQILVQAVSVCSAFQADGGQKEATARYVYGKFILENLMDLGTATEELTRARELTVGQIWTARRELGRPQESVFMETCRLLFQALMSEARELIKYSPADAAQLCALAKKRAHEACDHPKQADALMLQGYCELEANDNAGAVISFSRALRLQLRLDNPEKICEARIKMALAYLKINKYEQALQQLEILLEFAESKGLMYYVAQAYRYLGEYHLNQGTPHLATPQLLKALRVFDEMELFDINREQARNLAAVSAGQELLPKYIELTLKCGKKGDKGKQQVIKLVKWKNDRELFWSEGSELSFDSDSSLKFEQSLQNLSEGESHVPEEEDEQMEDDRLSEQPTLRA